LLRCRIGDGEGINIWQQPWIRSENNNFIGLCPHPSVSMHTVEDLIIEGTTEWDPNLVHAIVQPQIAYCITRIYIPSNIRNIERI